MKCPNCGKYMNDESYTNFEEFYHWEDEDWYYKNVHHKKFTCKNCNISIDNEKWDIPEGFLPTDKQIRTVAFINSRLHIQLEAITKGQCCRDISKYFEQAKKTPRYSTEDWFYIQDMYGMCEGDFC